MAKFELVLSPLHLKPLSLSSPHSSPPKTLSSLAHPTTSPTCHSDSIRPPHPTPHWKVLILCSMLILLRLGGQRDTPLMLLSFDYAHLTPLSAGNLSYAGLPTN
ncbi:unnamed protein product [Camellia sinensis]